MTRHALEYVLHRPAPGEFRLTRIERVGEGADAITMMKIIAESPDGAFSEAMRTLTFADMNLRPDLKLVSNDAR